MAIYSGFTHQKWWFSIATLNYQRVQGNPHGSCKIVCQRKPLVFSSAISEYPRKYLILLYPTIWLYHIVSRFIPMKTITHSLSHVIPLNQAFHQAVLDCMGFSNGPGPWWEIPMKPMGNPMGTSSFNEDIHFFRVTGKSIVLGQGIAWLSVLLLANPKFR